MPPPSAFFISGTCEELTLIEGGGGGGASASASSPAKAAAPAKPSKEAAMASHFM